VTPDSNLERVARMTHEQLALSQIIIGIITGGVGVAVFQWLTSMGKNKAEEKKINQEGENLEADTFKKLQEFWHGEFDRLEKRIEELEGDKKGQAMTITELKGQVSEFKEKVQVLQTQLDQRDAKIERLTARIRELERLMKKFGIDPDKVSEEK